MYLYILNGEEDGRRFDLLPGIYTIGRSSSVDIVLPGDQFISGNHAELIIGDGERVTLRDRGSKNGTFLLGEPVTSEAEVTPGDIFMVGRTFLKCSRRSHDRFAGTDATENRTPEAIVVVDIVGSSHIAQMMGDSMAIKIKNILQEALSVNLAQYPAEYKKGTGDGYMLIFSKPLAAVQFSQGLMTTLSASCGPQGFHIRIGINYGETWVLPDGDRRGSAVDMAFRVESAKVTDLHQTVVGVRKEDMPRVDRIFITETVQKLIASRPTIRTRSIGFFELKGFNGRHRIFEVLT